MRCPAFRISNQSRHSDRTVRTNRYAIPFGDLNRRTNNARALRLKDDIDTARELSIMVTNQVSDWVGTLGERPCDVPRLLRHPFAVGMRRAAGQVHARTRLSYERPGCQVHVMNHRRLRSRAQRPEPGLFPAPYCPMMLPGVDAAFSKDHIMEAV